MNRGSLLVLGTGLLALTGLPMQEASVHAEPLEAADIIERVHDVYLPIKTIRGQFRRSSMLGEQEQIVIGEFFIEKPDKVFVHNLDPTDSYMISNGQTLWLYDRKGNAVVKSPIPKEGRVPPALAGTSGMFEMNPFVNMTFGYECQRIGDYDQHLIVSCTPEAAGEQLSQVLIKVNPETWMVAAVELFDLSGNLISQTRYEGVKQVQGVFLFPHDIKTRLIMDGRQAQETVRYSRIHINDTPEDGVFEFEVPEGVEVLEEAS